MVKGAPAKMQQTMMEQMMKQAMSGAGGMPGGSPFGAPGASPFGAPPGGAGSPFGAGFPTPPAAGAPGFGATASAPSSQTVDVTAKPAEPASAPSSTAASASSTTPSAAAAGATSPPPFGTEPAAPTATKEEAAKEEGTKEAPAKEGAAKAEPAASAAAAAPAASSSVFGDVDPAAEKAKAEAASNVPPAGGGTFFADAEVVGSAGAGMGEGSIPGADAGATNGGGGAAGGMFSMDTIEKLLEDPKVQEMVYPYLPEGMRNPDTFKWMMSNPAYRQQMEEMLTNMSTDDLNAMGGGNFDMNSPEVKAQFDAIGTSPEEVIQKIMADPELAMAFQKPNVQSAIMDCSNNPQNYMKYVNDPEVMQVFEKVRARARELVAAEFDAAALPDARACFGGSFWRCRARMHADDRCYCRRLSPSVSPAADARLVPAGSQHPDAAHGRHAAHGHAASHAGHTAAATVGRPAECTESSCL